MVRSFEDFSAIKLVIAFSGTVKNLTLVEVINFIKVKLKATKFCNEAPGQ